MKTTRTIILTAFLSASFLLISGSAILQAAVETSAKRELVFLNWSEYMDPDLIDRFEKQYNARITEIFFESDDYRDNYMLETQGIGIDVIVVNGIQVRSYIEQNWIAPMTLKEVPNLKYIDNKWLSIRFASALDTD